jgi:mono/diheme cytochrome c family protein
MFYTSICGGCHGDDGKGLGGNYPDLTRKKLLGLERREESLKIRIKKLQNMQNKITDNLQ